MTPKHHEHTIEGYVWCDYYGTVHEDTEDPEEEGPRRPEDLEPEQVASKSWQLRSDHKGYAGALAFFVCPGEHRSLIVKGKRP